MDELVCERDGATAFVKLNRPAVRNALSLSLITALTACFEELNADPGVRIIVLGGNGRHFCAGADLEWMRASVGLDAQGNLRDAATLARLFAVIDQSPKAVIGDIHGAAFGGAVGLAAVCDYVLARDDAFFCLSEVLLGLIPAVIMPYVLAKIGSSATRAYCTSAERFDARRACELGLVHEVIASEEHDAAIARVLQQYYRAAPGAVAAAKSLLHDMIYESPSRHATANLTAQAIAERRVTAEAQEGIAAFLDGTEAPWLR